MGDAELDEGSNFEAIPFAGRHELSELNVVVIDNDSSNLAGREEYHIAFPLRGGKSPVLMAEIMKNCTGRF